jgi:Holliday junction resolvase RusA-like endonuclease
VQSAWLVAGRPDLGDGQLELSATFVFSDRKARDLSNCVKAIEDALQDQDGGRLCFRDDTQIVELVARKRPAEPGEEPHSEIELHAL